MLKQTIVTAVAVGSLVLSSGFAFADTGVGIIGNGTGTQNTVNVTSNTTANVGQTNNTTATTTITSQNNTGSNNANNNTGANVGITTGSATSTSSTTNAGGLNTVDLSGCGCNDLGNLTAVVSGNGAGARSALGVSSNNTTSLGQTNNTTFTTTDKSNNNTGSNVADNNTGGVGAGSTVSISTGMASSNDTVTNLAGVNSATLGGGSSAGAGSGVTAMIDGNGTDTSNSLNLGLSNVVSLGQTNNTTFNTTIKSNNNTGTNNANNNTGENVMLSTGNAASVADVTSVAGFNVADLSACGCVPGGSNLFKVAGNGADAISALNASFTNTLGAGQGNNTTFNTLVGGEGSANNTGSNLANANTGTVIGDPVVVSTGSSSSHDTVSNAGGVNVLGPNASVALPGNLGTLQVSTNFAMMWQAFVGAFTAFASGF